MSAKKFPASEDLVNFVYDEARLIDEKRLDEWFDLFTDDARYWMPLTRGQPDGEQHTSLFYEDKLLLQVRIERLNARRAPAQQQPSFCQHVLQQPRIESTSDDSWKLRTPFIYVETQLDEQVVLAGIAWHSLCVVDGRLRMRQKRVDLVNCDAAFPSIQLFP
ncbi:MAG: aromatic-ring-hydroxylating dioxygenase subunit beta [Steroidobacteraceae bacterium]